MKKTLTLALLVGCLAQAALAAIQTRDISYKEGKTELKGTLAWDDAIKGPRPGVLIVHSWMGLTDYEKGRAKQLAELGYTAFAVDVYGTADTPKDQKEAGVSAGKYKGNRALFRKRVQAGLDVLARQAEADKANLAAIGYCFGGTGALELARNGAKLKGVVCFHGGLDSPTPADGKKIRGKVLVLHGADDFYVPKKDIDAFEQELKAAKVDYQLVFYSGTVHAFTMPGVGNDPSTGAAYNASSDKRSWVAMKNFLQEIFGQ
jgi:dienelactone hydrolase